VLKQDMANRHQSYDQQIVEIKNRIKGGKGDAAPANNTAGAITVTDPRGVAHTFTTQAAADAFKKAAGIQ
jgi:hypothetical protein